MSLTIIEGVDGAGKSTLVEQWRRWLEYHHPADINVVVTHHEAYLDREEITSLYMLDLMNAHENPQDHYIMDRSWISEYVYGPVMRGKIRVDVAQRRALERMALTSSPLLIYCIPPFDICAANYQKRKQLEYVPNVDKLVQIYAGYQDIVETDRYDSFSALGWDYTAGNNSSLMQEFVRTAEGIREPANFGPGIGRFNKGNTLVINDGSCPYPPFSNYDGQTKWLSLLLDMAKVPERDLYYIGAKRPDGEPTAGGRWLNILKPQHVLALTELAEDWALKHGLRQVKRIDPEAAFNTDDKAIQMAIEIIKGGY